MSDDQAPNAEAQTSGDIDVNDVTGTGIAIGHNNVVQVTTIYTWARTQPTDPATIAAARALLAQLPTDDLPDPATLPPGSRMPFARTPTFVGRQPDLQAIAVALAGGQTTAIGQAATVHGMGGVGKTTVASEFVHRYGAYFAGGVFWLSFADPANILTEIAPCGGEGHLQLRPDFHDLPLAEQVAAVQRAWAEELPRLLVFDNVDTDDAEALVAQYRPTTGGCRVLITSRRSPPWTGGAGGGMWDTALGITALPLGVLPRAESVALLRQFRADLCDAEALAGELGDLPLALHLAGSFLQKYARSKEGDPAAFLARLRDPALLEHPALTGRATGAAWSYHERSVARTFALSYERLDPDDATDALARTLLARAACCAPGEPLPGDLVRALVTSADDLMAEDAQARLTALGLLEQDGDAVTLHRLLAAFVRQIDTDAEAQGAVEQVLMDYTGPLADIPAAWLPILPHLRHVTAVALWREDAQAATLANSLGYGLDMLADYAAARPLMERALVIRERVLGANHPSTAQSLNNLAELLQATGEYAAARPLMERALDIRERVLGADHPSTALSLNNLAELLRATGEYAAARPLYERTLDIRERVLGADHPDTASSLNNLAVLLRATGEYAAARPLYERALDIRERVLGADHPDTASSLNNLALLLRATGEYAAARPLYERALAIDEAVYGPDHPEVATDLNNLAELLKATGEFAAARALLERALAITERVLGADHPHTAQSLNNLAINLYYQQEFAAARALLERALVITERALGADHPHTATRLNNLALLLDATGEYAAARALLERALVITERALGADHPHTAQSLNNLAALLRATGEYAAARPLYERALDINERVLGADHPDTATSLNNLAGVHYATGEYAAARPLLERALVITERALGADHPHTAQSLNNLAALLRATGEYAAARPLSDRALAIWMQTLGP